MRGGGGEKPKNKKIIHKLSLLSRFAYIRIDAPEVGQRAEHIISCSLIAANAHTRKKNYINVR